MAQRLRDRRLRRVAAVGAGLLTGVGASPAATSRPRDVSRVATGAWAP